MLNHEYQLRTLSRALELLKSLEEAPGPLTLTEIAARLDEPTPVVFRMLKTLEAHGYLVRGPNHKRYSLSGRGDGLSSARKLVAALRALSTSPTGLPAEELVGVLGMQDGAAAGLLEFMQQEGFARESGPDRWTLAPGLLEITRPLLGSSLVSLMRPVMERLRDELRETVALFVDSSLRQMLIDIAPSREPIRYVVDVGSTFPLHRGAAGKAALAGMPEADLEAYLAVPVMAAEVPDPDALRAEIAAVRAKGFAISFGERVEGAAAVATWISDTSGVCCGVVNVLGPAFRLDRQSLARTGERLLEERARIVIPPSVSLTSSVEPMGGLGVRRETPQS